MTKNNQKSGIPFTIGLLLFMAFIIYLGIDADADNYPARGYADAWELAEHEYCTSINMTYGSRIVLMNNWMGSWEETLEYCTNGYSEVKIDYSNKVFDRYRLSNNR